MLPSDWQVIPRQGRDYRVAKKGQILFSVERKTVSNFLNDINTAKLARQKAEMIAENVPAFFIVEGAYIPPNQKIKFYRNYHITVAEQFTTYRTLNVKETLMLIFELPKMANMTKTKYFHMYQQPNFVADINKCKRIYDTPEANLYSILIQIPGFRHKLSSTVARTFGSVKNIFEIYFEKQKEVGVYIPGVQFFRSYNFNGMTEKTIHNLANRFDL